MNSRAEILIEFQGFFLLSIHGRILLSSKGCSWTGKKTNITLNLPKNVFYTFSLFVFSFCQAGTKGGFSKTLKRRFFQKWDFLLRVASPPPPRGFCWKSAKNDFLTKPFHFPMHLLRTLMFFENFQKFVV